MKSLVYKQTMTKLQILLSYNFGYECFSLASLRVESEDIHVRQGPLESPPPNKTNTQDKNGKCLPA